VYSKLPASVKTGLRTRLRTGQMAFDPDIVLELRRTVTHMLSWMVPLAEATASWERERSDGCQHGPESPATTWQRSAPTEISQSPLTPFWGLSIPPAMLEPLRNGTYVNKYCTICLCNLPAWLAMCCP